jgi:hypothetical protein
VREAKETFAYDLSQILQILDVLPLLPRAAVATASFVGLREGELRGVGWQDYNGSEMTVSRSIVQNRCQRANYRNGISASSGLWLVDNRLPDGPSAE